MLAWNLGAGSLLSSDDAIYAQMAREMVRDGAWLQPPWLGVPLFEKPPLLYWLLGLSGTVFGWSTFAMRLPGVLVTLVGLGCMLRLVAPWSRGHRAGTYVPLVAVGLCLATVAFTMTVRRPLADPLLCAAYLAVLVATLRVAARESRASSVALGVVVGLGILAKWVALGPVCLVSLVVLLRAGRGRALALAVVVSLLVAAPWHLTMTLRHGQEFWDVYLGYHVLDRASVALVGASDPLAFLKTAWEQDPTISLLLAAGLVGGTVRAWTEMPGPTRLTLGAVVGVAWVTLGGIQLSQTRLYHYLLPVVPLAAVATVAALGPLWAKPYAFPGLGLVIALSFVTGPLEPHLTAPDYSASTRRVVAQYVDPLPPDARVVLWEDYDPAMVWHADRPARIWTRHEGFYAVQQSVDMMGRSGAVVWADGDAVDALMASPEPILAIAPAERAAALKTLAGRASSLRRVTVTTDPSTERVIVHMDRRP